MQTSTARRPFVAPSLYCDACDCDITYRDHVVVTAASGVDFTYCSLECRARKYGRGRPPLAMRQVSRFGRSAMVHLATCDCHACRGALVGESV